MAPAHSILTVTCPSVRGIVAAISGYLAEKGCNIVDCSQFDDLDTDKFFMRIASSRKEGMSFDELVEGFGPVAEQFAMNYRVP